MSLKNISLLVSSFILVFTLGIIFGITLTKFFTPAEMNTHAIDQQVIDQPPIESESYPVE